MPNAFLAPLCRLRNRVNMQFSFTDQTHSYMQLLFSSADFLEEEDVQRVASFKPTREQEHEK